MENVKEKSNYVSIEDYQIYYEIHGNGPTQLLFLSDFMSSIANWVDIVTYFGINNGDEYTCLVIENKGFGLSSGNLGRYTTEGMANDTISVLNHVGWIETRSIHLVGMSMGGMIAQQLILMMPDYFKSLSLFASCSKHVFPKYDDYAFARTIHSILYNDKSKLELLFHEIFADQDWMKDDIDDSYFNSQYVGFIQSKTVQLNSIPPSHLITFIQQGTAVMSHTVTDEELRLISRQIPNILTISGSVDGFVDPSCTIHLAKHLNCEPILLEGKGHSLLDEASDILVKELQKVINDGEMRWG
ncbi:Alpha/Beta hydrolase protein [Globomyces pollinis-pini]|nr:Alpha/Beta hydrolase protein [Globomyces pollinis-pini]